MTPERWERVQDLYHACRTWMESDRARFLAEACAGDDALRREVQARFIVGWTALRGSDASAVQLFPLDGGPPVASGGWWSWSPGAHFASVTAADETCPYVVPLESGEPLSRMSTSGLRSEQDVSQLPGARKVTAAIVPGSSTDVYAFYRTTTQRNLYRIPIQ